MESRIAYKGQMKMFVVCLKSLSKSIFSDLPFTMQFLLFNVFWRLMDTILSLWLFCIFLFVLLGNLLLRFRYGLDVLLFGLNFLACSSEGTSGFLVSLLFGLGPLLGGNILVAFALAFHLQHALLTGVASGIAFILGAWRPLQLLFSSKMGFFPLSFLLAMGSGFTHISTSTAIKLATRKKTSANTLSDATGFSMSALTLQSILSCLTVALHALAEGLALGVAAPKAYGLGRHMVLPVSLHGLIRGAAVASCIFGATDSWYGSLAGSAFIGIVGPISAIAAILAGIDYSGLDHLMVFACGGLIPCFWSMFKRAMRLDRRKSMIGVVTGVGFATFCLMCTKLVCLHTPYCNSAPEAVR